MPNEHHSRISTSREGGDNVAIRQIRKIFSFVAGAALASTCAAYAPAASAQAGNYPNHPITLIVPFPAGGAIDIVARIVAKGLGENLKTSVVVENKTGASGNIGAQYVVRSAPDGYTLLMASLTTFDINVKTYGAQQMGYDLLKDFRAVAVVSRMPEVLVVNSKVPANNLKELIAWLKQNPGTKSYGSSGKGSIGEISGELLKQRAGVQMQHVPYRGTAPALVDVMADHIQMMFATTPTVVPELSGGKLKVIGVAALDRSSSMPDMPTLDEQGLKGFDVTSYPGVLVPRATPEAIVTRLNQAIQIALKDPQTQKQLEQQGAEALLNDPKQAEKLFVDGVKHWSDMIDETKVSVGQ
jgi:tripartite-type tricarboxylate transporter receptor subunit TctC